MSEVLRLILGIGVLTYLLVVFYLLKRRLIDLKYSFVWMFAGVFMIVFIIWPNLLYGLMDTFGITVPVNGLFVICIGFVIIILMSLTSIVSKQADKIRQLVQTLAILEKRIRTLEKGEE